MNTLHFDDLAWQLRLCVEEDDTIAKQLDIYPQLKSLYDYFKNCIFSDDSLEEGKTYILPIDVEVGLFDIDDYEIYADPDEEEYDPDSASFVESHNKHVVDDEFVGVTLKAGTQFIYNGVNRYTGMSLIVDGYDLDWYATLIGTDRYGNEGPVPFVIKA